MKFDRRMSSDKWIDSHIHLTDQRWGTQGMPVDSMILEANKLGIHFFMQGGINPEEWANQLNLARCYPQKIGLCFGLHPYWVSEHSENELDVALDLLAPLIPQALGLGETGLDLRPHIVKDSIELQYKAFEAQLELADFSSKPLVLHIVRAFDEAIQIFDVWGISQSKGMVHSFNGSMKQAAEYVKRGFYLSLGGPLCRPDNQRLQQAVHEIPMDYILLESDGPDQPGPRWEGMLNPSYSIIDVAEQIARIKGNLTKEQVLNQASSNFMRLFIK